MDNNQLQRNLKEPIENLIKFLGDQGTTQPEFTVAKIALEHRMQKRLILPTWILTIFSIAALAISIIQMVKFAARINYVESELRSVLSSTNSDINNH